MVVCDEAPTARVCDGEKDDCELVNEMAAGPATARAASSRPSSRAGRGADRSTVRERGPEGGRAGQSDTGEGTPLIAQDVER